MTETLAEDAILLHAEHLSKSFVTGRSVFGKATSRFTAVDDVTFTVRPGRTTAIVGESGSGKSTTARLAAMLEQPDSGRVTVEGRVWSEMSERQRRPLRPALQFIFQDPYGALDPTKEVIDLVSEPLTLHQRLSRSDIESRVRDLLVTVGLSPDSLFRRAAEFSGGQRQRICIARALSTEPRILFADESVSALDVSIQAQVLGLLRDIQYERNVGMLFISHDLGVVRQIADEVVVMRHGSVVEAGTADEVFESPRDQYTKRLIAAVPKLRSVL